MGCRKNQNSNHNLQIAACALLLEIATADDEFKEEEKVRITELMKAQFDLTEDEVSRIISKSEEEINNSVSLYEFTDVLNKNLNSDEKYQILKYLWHIAYSDGNLDSYEDHYIKKISNNLPLSVSNMYQAIGGCSFHIIIILIFGDYKYFKNYIIFFLKKLGL